MAGTGDKSNVRDSSLMSIQALFNAPHVLQCKYSAQICRSQPQIKPVHLCSRYSECHPLYVKMGLIGAKSVFPFAARLKAALITKCEQFYAFFHRAEGTHTELVRPLSRTVPFPDAGQPDSRKLLIFDTKRRCLRQIGCRSRPEEPFLLIENQI